MAVFSVQDAQSQRFLPVENSPASLFSISMGGKGGGYTYIIKELPQSKPVGFASSLWEGANPLSPLPLVASSSPEGGAFCHLPVNATRAPPFGGAGIAQR